MKAASQRSSLEDGSSQTCDPSASKRKYLMLAPYVLYLKSTLRMNVPGGASYFTLYSAGRLDSVKRYLVL